MTTAVDVSRLLADAGPKVALAGPQQVLGDGVGSVFSGFSSLSSVYVEAQIQLVRAVSGPASLVLLMEHSDDGSSWSTAETFMYGADGTQTATLASPKNYLRASWTVGNSSEWYLRSIVAALGAAGGSGTSAALATFSQSGTLSAGAGASRFPMPAAGTITGAVAAVNTAPSGQSLICDVNKNGTTIFTTQANRPTIAAGSRATTTEPAPDVTTFAAGDYLTVDIDQVGSGTAGADLVVNVVYTLT